MSAISHMTNKAWCYHVVAVDSMGELELDARGNFMHFRQAKRRRTTFYESLNSAASAAYTLTICERKVAVLLIDFSTEIQSGRYMSCLGYTFPLEEQPDPNGCAASMRLNPVVALLVMDSMVGDWGNILPMLRQQFLGEVAAELDPAVQAALKLRQQGGDDSES